MAGTWRSFGVGVLALSGWLWITPGLLAQEPPLPSALPDEPPEPPAVAEPGAATNEALLKELQELRKQVQDVKDLQEEVKDLRGQLEEMQKKGQEQEKQQQEEAAPQPKLFPGADDGTKPLGNDPRRGSALASGLGTGFAGPQAGFGPTGSWTGGPADDAYPLKLKYIYNRGGGAFAIADPSNEFTAYIQNQITFDGTFQDRQELPTRFKGFTIPFQRTYLYGNITRYIEYQVSEQAFLGEFNLLDMFVNFHYDDRMMFRFGKFLSPFLYEYYAFSPAWEPVINNSPLFQLAGKRQVGAMVWGKLFDYKVQYMAGIFNGPNGFYFDLDNNRDFAGALTVTPFKGNGVWWLDSLGVGASMQVGWQDYFLRDEPAESAANGVGEPTLNRTFVTSSGVPFFQFDRDVRALGNRTKVAPHFFWFGRFSVLGEYVYQTRYLADRDAAGFSNLHAWYVNASYFLTGERYNGDGTGGYTPISPIRPFMPARGQFGPGAWELAAQVSQMFLDGDDIERGFASDIWATQLNQLMVGINWWPTKWTRISFDWVYQDFNEAIPTDASGFFMMGNDPTPVEELNTFWTRVAVFF